MSTMGSHSSEPNTKRRRLERDSSRSGLGSEDEGAGGDELAGTPLDSVHTFTAARLGSASGSLSPGPLLLPPLTAEPGGEGLVKKESGEGGRESESAALVEGGGEIKEGQLIQTSGAYCAREARWNTEEAAGRLKFVCHYNDGIEQHMMWLVGLKNIFARQLPNMPKEYIVRLVLDRSHKSMMIIKQQAVVGGITYRPYLQQKFGEIAFCAITASEQVKGYGSRLMNQLKQYARDEDKLTHFLTYADNNAVGYFSKQGFTKHISLEEERWKGFIKDYDGGTLMECVLEPLLPYIDLPNVIRRQRQAIDGKIRELSNCHLVYPGLDLHKNEYGVPRKPIKIEDIPGLKAAGWTPEESPSARLRLVSLPSDGPPSRSQLHTFLRSLHRVISEHPDAWPFKEPVNPKEVADYYDVIKDPIDLKTMSKRLDSEVYYLHLEMFVSDMRRMFSNAMNYNSPETIYYKAAKRLEVLFMNRLKAGVQLSRSAAQGS